MSIHADPDPVTNPQPWSIFNNCNVCSGSLLRKWPSNGYRYRREAVPLHTILHLVKLILVMALLYSGTGIKRDSLKQFGMNNFCC